MKLIRLSALTAALLALSLLSTVRAQTDRPSVPALINYQSYITDASNVPYGAVTGTNYDVVFRIYSAGTGGTLLWAEKQTVTIAAGQMSVLLGNGVANGADPRPNLATLFGPGGTTAITPSMFLELTVNSIGQTTALPFTPRQQLVANPFALRAKTADSAVSVAAGGVTGTSLAAGSVSGGALGSIADGSITADDIAPSTITGAKLVSGSVTTTQLADNSVTSAKIVDGTITSEDIFDGTITSADLGPSVGLWDRNGTNLYYTGGRVGIGTSNPAPLVTNAKLGVSGGHIIVDNNFGILSLNAAGALGAGFDTTADNSIQFYTGGANKATIDTTGNIRMSGNSLYATGGEENLRIVRGKVSDLGAKEEGSGFTSSRIDANGVFEVNFSTPFTDVPAITANVVLSAGASNPPVIAVINPTNSSFRIQTWPVGGFGPLRFNFIAVGPR